MHSCYLLPLLSLPCFFCFFCFSRPSSPSCFLFLPFNIVKSRTHDNLPLPSFLPSFFFYKLIFYIYPPSFSKIPRSKHVQGRRCVDNPVPSFLLSSSVQTISIFSSLVLSLALLTYFSVIYQNVSPKPGLIGDRRYTCVHVHVHAPPAFFHLGKSSLM